jgi:uncharacterized protein (TIGR02145 family)
MGWHVPTIQEVNNLNTFLGSNGDYKLKEVGDLHWYSDYVDPDAVNGTNEFGFTALPGGILKEFSMDLFEFEYINNSGYWWTISTQYNDSLALYANSFDILRFSTSSITSSSEKKNGLSVRLVKD